MSLTKRKQRFGFPIRSNTNRHAQSQKQARSLNFWIGIVGPSNCVAKTKALISCAVTAQLICVFVFAYADCLFSCSVANLKVVPEI